MKEKRDDRQLVGRLSCGLLAERGGLVVHGGRAERGGLERGQQLWLLAECV